MKIHTFGDSHSHEGWQHIENNKTFPIPIIVHLLGPKLMYSFGKEKLNLLNIKSHGVQENDIVVFCFGEIDCRCHVHKFKEQGYKNILTEVINNYIEAIKMNVEQYNKITTCIYNIVPPVRKEITPENPEYPYLGTNEERRNYVTFSNSLISKKCREENYIFIDIYNQHSNEDGYLKHSDGTLHIGTPLFLEEFLRKTFLN